MTVEFTTIPASKMLKAKQTSKVSADVLETRQVYDQIIAGLANTPDEAGMIKVPEGSTPRSIRMNLRYASDRTDHQLVINKFVVSEDKKAVQFTVGRA